MPTRLILASASPRRRELLALTGLAFAVRPTDLPEVPAPGESPAAFVRRMSQAKAKLAAERAEPGDVVLAADTIVVLEDAILGKPADAADAARLLRRLRDRTHQVYTGVAAVNPATGAEADECVEATVPMRAYTDLEIDTYVATGNPLDKAGAYAIQYGGFQPVDLAAFHDCFANVMGLPLCTAQRVLATVAPQLTAGAPAPADCRRFDLAACPFFARIDKASLA